MKELITAALIKKLQPDPAKEYDVWDAKLTGFHVRVQRNGRKFYRCRYQRNKNKNIGSVELFTPAEARQKAMVIILAAQEGKEISSRKLSAKVPKLREFVVNSYEEWRVTNRKAGAQDIDQIKKRFFADFGDTSLDKISFLAVEGWRTKRLKNKIKPVTINRNISLLKSLLNKAVEWGIIKHNPLVGLKLSKIDNSRIRYLTPEEEGRLRNALENREKVFKERRASANQWRQERGYKLLPDFNNDHIRTMVLLSLNTGLRKGELLNLRWENVSFEKALLTVSSASAKSGKARHIPLNSEALIVLKDWYVGGKDAGFVFPNKDGKPIKDIKTAWKHLLKEAKISGFRWHDLRHHFASMLVMAGADLNSVRELLGHADLKMTLRYAHLAPEHKAKVVALLDKKRE